MQLNLEGHPSPVRALRGSLIVPSWKHRQCDACGTAVAYKDEEKPPRLCQYCWGDPLKRAAALFGDDPDEDPANLPVVPSEARTPRPQAPGNGGMTGMYSAGPAGGGRAVYSVGGHTPSRAAGVVPGVGAALGMSEQEMTMALVFAPGWLMERVARKLLGWA